MCVCVGGWVGEAGREQHPLLSAAIKESFSAGGHAWRHVAQEMH